MHDVSESCGTDLPTSDGWKEIICTLDATVKVWKKSLACYHIQNKVYGKNYKSCLGSLGMKTNVKKLHLAIAA